MKYGQKVRVTSGFYEGMEGKLHYPSESNKGDKDDCYGVWMDDPILPTITFLLSELEIIN